MDAFLSDQSETTDYVRQFKEWLHACKTPRSIFVPPIVPPPFVIYFYTEQDDLEKKYKKDKSKSHKSKEGFVRYAANLFMQLSEQERREYDDLVTSKQSERQASELAFSLTHPDYTIPSNTNEYQHFPLQRTTTFPFSIIYGRIPTFHVLAMAVGYHLAGLMRNNLTGTLRFSLKELRRQLEADFGVSLFHNKAMIESIVRTYIDPEFRELAKAEEPQTQPQYTLFSYYQFGVPTTDAAVLAPEQILREKSAPPTPRPSTSS